MSINLNDIVMLNNYGVDYRCNINGVSKSDAVNLLIIKIPISPKKNITKIKKIIVKYKMVKEIIRFHNIEIGKINVIAIKILFF